VFSSSPDLNNCFTITNGSNVVTVVDAQYQPNVGDFVSFVGANTVSTSNVTGLILNDEFEIVSLVNSTAYTITVSVTANASATTTSSTQIQSQVINNITNVTNVTENITQNIVQPQRRRDPLAQSFFVDDATGIFVIVETGVSNYTGGSVPVYRTELFPDSKDCKPDDNL
jgi:hypothetical protein